MTLPKQLGKGLRFRSLWWLATDLAEVLWRFGPVALVKRVQLKTALAKWDSGYVPERHREVDREPNGVQPLPSQPLPSQPYDLVIPVFKSEDDLRRLLGDLINNPPANAVRIILGDDNSQSPEVTALLQGFAEQDPRARVVAHSQNHGFAGNVTRLLRVCEQQISIVLNTDTRLNPSALDRLAEHFQGQPRLAAICPLSNNAVFAELYSAKERRQLTPEDVLSLDQDLAETPPGSYEAPFASGFCWGLNRELFLELGGFNPDFAAGYGEEADYCLRARRAGFVSAVATNIAVFHEGSKSFGRRNALRLSRLNSSRLLKLYPEYLTLVRWLPKWNGR